MGLTSFISKYFSDLDRTTKFDVICDDGLDFSASPEQLKQIRSGKASEWITAQFVALKMLEEQGDITPFPDGFTMPSSTAVRLDNELRILFELPEIWDGYIDADIKGKTSLSTFIIDLAVRTQQGHYSLAYDINGPFIQFGKETLYLLTPEQLLVFEARETHKKSQKTEYDNLLFLHSLQVAQQKGFPIKLKHFDKLKILTPSSISVEAELNKDGDLILTPNMGQNASNEAVQRVLGQLNSDTTVTLKIGDEIVLFSEKKLKAMKEIISNRVVPKDKIKAFLANPTAFIDASLVDLDIGFSMRVHGATAFKHAYFGETDESGIDWFGAMPVSETIYPISKISDVIHDNPTLINISRQLSDAHETGATVFDYEEKSYDINDRNAVNETLKNIAEEILHPVDRGVNEFESDDKESFEENVEYETYVVDIDLNDEELSASSPGIEKQIFEVSWKGKLNWDNYKRTPFPHQEIGVRWILGLEEKSRIEQSSNGALLADDMGLGKTFMALSAIEHIYQRLVVEGKTKKPVLIVAPLSLLENWQDEVQKTFHNSPFKDIVILQSNVDLNTYRDGGVEIRGQNAINSKFEPRYSLKVGQKFGNERLDLPERLVITTYQTLRDYQFSFCLIDWGMIVFDEAQNTKNPNALQTRAAKGLKSEFKLVATGTPVENSLADFWCLMDTACPGYLGSYQEFRIRYITPILKAAGDEVEDVRAQLGRKLRLDVGALMLRRVKEDNLKGLPAKYMYAGGDFSCDFTGWQFMKELKSSMVDYRYQREIYEGSISNQLENKNSNALATLLRLKNSSLHPRLCDGGQLNLPKNRKAISELYQESGKLSSLLEILKVIQDKQEKCIIFAINKRLQSFLSITLGQLFDLGPLSVINGDAKAIAKRKSVPTRKSMIAEFEDRIGFNLIVMSPIAAGVGLTVVGANHVVHLERHWNPAKEAQATDRVYRIGQTKDVHIYIPLLHHPEFESFDVNLHKLLTKKTLLKDAVVTPEDVVPQPSGVGSSVSGELILKRITGEDIDKLSWQQFEALCVEALSKHYNADSAWLTNLGADYGADGIILSDAGNILIQVKHTQRKYDGYKAIQEVHAAKPVYEKAMGKQFDRLIFITNSPLLAKRTIEIAKNCKVEVLGRQQLISLLEDIPLTYKDILVRLEKQRMKV